MYLVALGIVFLVLKLMHIGPVASWAWPWVLAPFGAAACWWWFADATGMTARQTMEREQKRKQDRLDRTRANLGQPPRRRDK